MNLPLSCYLKIEYPIMNNKLIIYTLCWVLYDLMEELFSRDILDDYE